MGGWSTGRDRTHVGKGQGAPAAAFIGLFVAPQLVEGARLAEQCPDTLAVQAQRLLTVLQRLLIQALGETIRRPNGQHLDPRDGKHPHFPAEEPQGDGLRDQAEELQGRGKGRRVAPTLT